jgi:hypothetical protein
MMQKSTNEFLKKVQQFLDRYTLDKELKLVKVEPISSPESADHSHHIDMDLHSFSFGAPPNKKKTKVTTSASSVSSGGSIKSITLIRIQSKRQSISGIDQFKNLSLRGHDTPARSKSTSGLHDIGIIEEVLTTNNL